MDKASKLASSVLFGFSMALIVALMFLTSFDVIGRFLGHAIPGSYQMSELTQVWVICLAWPFTTRVLGHVTVDFVTSRMPPGLLRVFQIMAHVIGMAIFSTIAWQGIEMMRRSREQGELVSILDIPIFPFQLAMPIGGLVTFFVLLVQLCLLVAGRELKEGAK